MIRNHLFVLPIIRRFRGNLWHLKIVILHGGKFLGCSRQQSSFHCLIILSFNDEKLYFLSLGHHRISLLRLCWLLMPCRFYLIRLWRILKIFCKTSQLSCMIFFIHRPFPSKRQDVLIFKYLQYSSQP